MWQDFLSGKAGVFFDEEEEEQVAASLKQYFSEDESKRSSRANALVDELKSNVKLSRRSSFFVSGAIAPLLEVCKLNELSEESLQELIGLQCRTGHPTEAHATLMTIFSHNPPDYIRLHCYSLAGLILFRHGCKRAPLLTATLGVLLTLVPKGSGPDDWIRCISGSCNFFESFTVEDILQLEADDPHKIERNVCHSYLARVISAAAFQFCLFRCAGLDHDFDFLCHTWNAIAPSSLAAMQIELPLMLANKDEVSDLEASPFTIAMATSTCHLFRTAQCCFLQVHSPSYLLNAMTRASFVIIERGRHLQKTRVVVHGLRYWHQAYNHYLETAKRESPYFFKTTHGMNMDMSTIIHSVLQGLAFHMQEEGECSLKKEIGKMLQKLFRVYERAPRAKLVEDCIHYCYKLESAVDTILGFYIVLLRDLWTDTLTEEAASSSSSVWPDPNLPSTINTTLRVLQQHLNNENASIFDVSSSLATFCSITQMLMLSKLGKQNLSSEFRKGLRKNCIDWLSRIQLERKVAKNVIDVVEFRIHELMNVL